jgi:hypothetical protein
MKSPLLVATSLSIALVSAPAIAQQGSGTTEHVYYSNRFAPSRTVERRSQTGGRELVVQTEESIGPDGRWIPVEEIVTERTRDGNGIVRTHRDVFGFDADRRRVLRETTDTTAEPSTNGIAKSVADTRVMDINGSFGLASRRIEHVDTVDSDVRLTTTTLLTRGIDGGLRETERTVDTERRLGPSLVRHETAHSLRDANGRWMPIASYAANVRRTGPEHVEEETVQRPDLNGRLVPTERIVTRRSESNGQEQATVETYSQDAEGFSRSGGRLALSQRVRRSTTTTSDGQATAEVVEARSRVSPGDPMRVVQRTVVTVRNVASGRQITERQVFELDVNGRLAPVLTETEEAIDQ